jgi:hypothetical protein
VAVEALDPGIVAARLLAEVFVAKAVTCAADKVKINLFKAKYRGRDPSMPSRVLRIVINR